MPSTRTVDTTGKTLIGRLDEAENPPVLPVYIEERVTIAASAAATNLTQKLPARTYVDTVLIKPVGAGTVTTATHVGLGVGSDVDALAEIAIGSINASSDAEVVQLADTPWQVAGGTISLNGTNGSGSAAGTIDTLDVIVVILGRQFCTLST